MTGRGDSNNEESPKDEQEMDEREVILMVKKVPQVSDMWVSDTWMSLNGEEIVKGEWEVGEFDYIPQVKKLQKVSHTSVSPRLS